MLCLSNQTCKKKRGEEIKRKSQTRCIRNVKGGKFLQLHLKLKRNLSTQTMESLIVDTTTATTTTSESMNTTMSSPYLDIVLWLLLFLFLVGFVVGSGYLIWTVYQTISQRSRQLRHHRHSKSNNRKTLRPPPDVLLRMRLRDSDEPNG